MVTYLVRRFLLMIPTFLGITFMLFAITRIVPGGPIERMIQAAQARSMEDGGRRSVHMNAQPLSEEQIETLKKLYHLDKPIVEGYFAWLGQVLRGDLGESTRYWVPVWDMLVEKMPISLYLGTISALLTYLISIPLGVWKAIRHGSWMDTATSILIFVGYAIPSYILALLLMFFVASISDTWPILGIVSENFSELSLGEKIIDLLQHSLLPLLAMLPGSFAFIATVMKNSTMVNLSADYVRTAMAKGVSFPRAIFGHALRNSLIPIAGNLAALVMIVVTGNFLIEVVFNIDGMGLLSYESVTERDYPVFLGYMTLVALLLMLSNILADVLVAIIDPRVRFH